MPKINDTTTYPNTTPALADHVPGTDVSNTGNDAAGETVTFTFQAVMDLFEANFAAPATAITSGTFADARIAASNVTQHQAALTITESQISDLGAYLTTLDLGGLSDVTLTTAAQGHILYRNASGWVNLAPGTSGQYLQTQGAGANPQWATPAGGGSLSNIVEDTTPQLGGDLDTQGNSITGGLIMPERADHAATPTAGSGEIWIKNDATQTLYFTDDAGSDREILTSSSGTTLSGITAASDDKLFAFDTSNSDAPGTVTISGALTAAKAVVSEPAGVTGADQITNIMSLTSAEYAAIGTPNASTLYIITDA